MSRIKGALTAVPGVRVVSGSPTEVNIETRIAYMGLWSMWFGISKVNISVKSASGPRGGILIFYRVSIIRLFVLGLLVSCFWFFAIILSGFTERNLIFGIRGVFILFFVGQLFAVMQFSEWLHIGSSR
jgi:hypothetical protein